VAILVAFYAHTVALGFVGVALMFGCAVVFERNLRRMGKAGWHDLTRTLHQDRPQGSEPQPGIEGAVDNARTWLRTRFRRDR
jgi:hypothetical protein